MSYGYCNPYSDFEAAHSVMSPYVNAIHNKDPDEIVQFVYFDRPPKINDSQDYQWTELYYGQSGGYYLFKNKNDINWTYFRSFDNTPDCSEFKTDPLIHQAFKGVSCYNPSGRSSTLQ